MVRNLVPQFVLEQFIQGHFHGRFQAVTLFIDISGFTATTNIFMQRGKEGGEAMAEVMQAIFTPLVEAVYEQGGFITGFAGDAFTAVFPAAVIPSTRTPAAARALAAAVTMQQQMLASPSRITPHGTFQFSIKIGLSSGTVEWGIVGEYEFENMARLGELSHAYYFRGPAIDGSASAEQLAGANEIVVTSELLPMLQHLVQFVPRADLWLVREIIAPLPLPEPVFSPPADFDLLATFVPRQILEQQVQGEYRHVLTLFLNLRQVHTHQQLAPFVQRVFELQRNYGGYLNTIDFGDKGCTLLLFWGMPTSYENDVARMFTLIEALQKDTAVEFRAGITYWLMYAGFVGSSRLRQEYSCYGRGVNLAARLMIAAPWGQAWTDTPVRQHAGNRYQFIARGEFQFKGFTNPQPAYEFAGQNERALIQFQGEMVGRQSELARMAKFVRPLQKGRFAGTLIISGEAGIGKSRLVDAFQRSAFWQEHWPEPRWLYGQTDEILRQSLNPFRYLLQRYFQQSQMQRRSENEERFDRQWQALLEAAEDAELVQQLEYGRSFLGALVNLEWPESPYAQITGNVRYDNTLLALQAFFKVESRRAPLILHIEDVHWLDDASWQCLRLLAQTLRQYPVAIILTRRESLETAPPDLPKPVVNMSLTALGEAGLAQLAMQFLGRPPSPRLLRLLVDRSDGNPFFAEQILLYLQEQGLPDPEDAPDATATLLPLDVRAILVARLDRLTQSVREVVQRAAILGREFDVQLLSYMLQDESHLEAKVKDAERANIWIALTQMRYLFKHALLRDAAYDMQLQARRRELHRLAANALTTLYTSNLMPFYGELAYHYGQAELTAEELDFTIRAAQQAAQRFAYGDALRYLNRALELLPAADTDWRFSLLLDREEAYHVQGKREEQAADLEALARLGDSVNETRLRAVAAVRLSRYADVTSDFPAAAAAARSAVVLAEETAAPDVEANGRLYLGKALWRQGEYEAAFSQLNTALAMYREQDNPVGVSQARHQLGVLTYEQGDYAASKTNYEELLVVNRALGDRMREGNTLTNLGAVANFQGNFPQARAYTLQALKISQELGFRQREGSLLLNLGVVARNVGDFAAAKTYLEQALPISQEVGERNMESVVLTNLTLLYHQLGDQETAVAFGRRALAALQTLNSPIFRSYALTWLAHALTALNQLPEAARHYEEVIAIRRDLGQTHLVVEPLAGLARVALARLDLDQVQQHGQALYGLIAHDPTLTGTEEPVRIYLTCFNCLATIDFPAAAQMLEQGYLFLQERAAFYDDPEQRRDFLNIPAHRELVSVWEQQAR